MCAHIDNAMKQQQTVWSGYNRVNPHGNCFEPLELICGDGFVDDSEECDEGVDTACCVGCMLVGECAGGECCNNECMFAPTTTSCEGGYCSLGSCHSSNTCTAYGLPYCGTRDDNACFYKCEYSGACNTMEGFTDSSTGAPLDMTIPDGAVCDLSPHSECQNQVCTQLESTMYYWYTSSFGTCDVECGIGEHTRTVQCRIVDTTTAVADSYCDNQGDLGTKPYSSQACDTGVTCVDYDWVTATWSECSVNCGPEGVQNRAVTCVDSISGTVDNSEVQCDAGTKPITSQTGCNAGVYCSWVVLDSWIACSAECGGGTQTRTVECHQEGGNTVAGTYCDAATEPLNLQACNEEECPQYYWVPNYWYVKSLIRPFFVYVD